MVNESFQTLNKDDDLEIFRLIFQVFDKDQAGYISINDLFHISDCYLNQEIETVTQIVN